MTSEENVKQVVQANVRDFNGRLDIFVANAGIPWTQGRMIDGELSHYHKVVSTDLDSVFYCARAAGEVWRRQYQDGGKGLDGQELENYSYGSFVGTTSMSGHIVNIPQLQSAVSCFSTCFFSYLLCRLLILFLLVQRRKSRHDSPLQVARRGMGQVRSRQHSLAWLHGHRDFQLRAAGDQSHLEVEDPNG